MKSNHTAAGAASPISNDLNFSQRVSVIDAARELSCDFIEWGLSREEVTKEAEWIRKRIVEYVDRFGGGQG